MFAKEVSEILDWTAVASRQFKEALISVLYSSNLPAVSAVAYHILPERPDLGPEVIS